MPTFHLATTKQRRNAVRLPVWNVAVGAGDDLKLALTVYEDDAATPVQTRNARSRLSLVQEDGLPPYDYGASWGRNSSQAETVSGFNTTVRPGGVNFAFQSSRTRGFSGRYRMAMFVDLFDGHNMQLEGILQVRGGDQATLGHVVSLYFQLDNSSLGTAPLAPYSDDGLILDADGFSLIDEDWVPRPIVRPALAGIGIVAPGTPGFGLLDNIGVPGPVDPGPFPDPDAPPNSSVLGVGVLGVMVLGGTDGTVTPPVVLPPPTPTLTEPRPAALQAQWVMGAEVVNGQFYFVFTAPDDGDIGALDSITGFGSFDVTVAVNGVNVPGLVEVPVDQMRHRNVPLQPRPFNQGDQITGVVSSAIGAPTEAVLNLEVTWR